MIRVVLVTAVVFACVHQSYESATGVGLSLLPIAQITGHAGLWAHGISSVALLKLKAAAALGALFAFSGRGLEINLGGGHDDHGHGWRRKRDAGDFNVSFDSILKIDTSACGLRLICELSSSPKESLQQDEQLILTLFAKNGKYGKRTRGKLSYDHANQIGKVYKNKAVCANTYSSCPVNHNQIMEYIRSINI